MSDNRQSLSDLGSIAAGEQPVQTADTSGTTATDSTVEMPTQPAAPTMPLRAQELDAYGRAYATGRRKDAVARVWLKPGTGKITVNGRDSEV